MLFRNRATRVQHKNQKRRFYPLRIEALEKRELMATDILAIAPAVKAVESNSALVATKGNLPLGELSIAVGAVLSNGVVTVTGSNSNDNISIYADNGKLVVHEVVKNRTWLSVNLTSVNNIVVNANAGNDWVNVDPAISIPVTLRGGAGNDQLQGGSAGDYLYGGTGNDELYGRGGSDNLYGEDGDDLLVGGTGNDIEYGGVGNDYLLGGLGNDVLYGDAGDDQIFGEAGNDVLLGGDGKNLLDGGAGIDYLYGGAGIDSMYGGDGDDYLRGFAGDDRLRGDAGNDTIKGDDGNDIADGGLGNDYMIGDAGNDVLSGDVGNDSLFGGAGQDWLDGGSGADSLYGGDGNDWLQGGSGTDTVNGGTGSNKVYQNYADGYVQYGTSSQSLGLGGITDFLGDVWNGIVDFFNWTLDKAEAIGTRFLDWASHIDDRIYRFGSDMAGALSNWPWKADFWKGLGRSIIDVAELGGLTEAFEIATEILKPWQRGMTTAEINVAKQVFGTSIPYDRVRFDEYSLMAKIGRTHTTGFIINSTSNLDDRTMIHELTHVWQYVTKGLVYIPEAIDAQNSDVGYDFGGITGLKAVKSAGGHFSSFNVEQQGEIIATYFDLRNQARTYELNGQVAPLSLRQDLDVYIYFVKEVSSLTAAQLDTPDPVIKTNGTVVISPTKLANATQVKATATPTTTVAPKLSAAKVDAVLSKV